MSAVEEIDSAIAALDAGDDDAALGAALRAWRLARVPAIADAIDAISTRLDVATRRPGGRTVADRHAAWLEIAKKSDPADVPALLATFMSEGKQEQLTERLALLEALERDPRVACAGASLIANPGIKINAAWRPFWVRVVVMTRKIGDERILPMQKEIENTIYRTTFRKRRAWLSKEDVATLFATVEGRKVEADPETAAAAARLTAAIAGAHGTKKGSATELFDRIYAEPGDASTYPILADVLQELGDPRGEFVALQLGPKRTRREKQLLKDHLTSWLGPLAPVVVEKTAVFESGFLARCGVACRSKRVAEEIVSRPEWATVREIALFSPGRGNYWEPDPVPLLGSPQMRSLRRVTDIHLDVLTKLGSPIALTSIRATSCGERAAAALDAAVELVPRLSDLDVGRIGEISNPWLEAFFATALVRRVDRLAADVYHDEAIVEWLALAQRDHASIAAARVVARRSEGSRGWMWSLGRDDRGALSVLTGTYDHNRNKWSPWRETPSPLERARAIVSGLAGGLTKVALRSRTPLAHEPERLGIFDTIRAAAGHAEITFTISDATATYEIPDDD